MTADFGEEIGLTNQDASLGTAKEFVAGETNQVSAFGERLLHGSFVCQPIFGRIQESAGAKIHHERHIVKVCQFGKVLEGGLFGETDDLEIGLMCYEQQAGAFGDRLFEVSETCAIGGADLKQFGTRLLHHIRDAKSPTNFHQLRARDGYFFAFRQRA